MGTSHNVFLAVAGMIIMVSGGAAAMSVLYPTPLYQAASILHLGPQPDPWPLPLDKTEYDRRMLALANYPETNASDTATTTPIIRTPVNATVTATSTEGMWPPATAYPNGGALLPFNRIVAYYGNFYSTAMGALGEYEPEEMLRRLQAEVAAWEAADPNTPVIPAIHYIAVVAQAGAGFDGKYRARMPDDQIEKALALAEEVDGVVFLDLQVGLSDLPSELPLLHQYLTLPNVHLAIDPEFAMQGRGNARPGTVIGTYDAADVNYAATYLAEIVREYRLPPKVLVVHRFTQAMLTNAEDIEPLPEVQVVIDMDGWGPKWQKIDTYEYIVAPEPVQFTGFKIFYKNDLKPPSTGLFTPEEVLELSPSPIYIQYQ